MTRVLITVLLVFLKTFVLGQINLPKQTAPTKPFVLGVTEEIWSRELNEKRLLNIYLPEGYNLKDTTKYPVVYLLDGSANEDFIHIAGLIQFNSFEWVNQVPKSIVVGIETVDRKRDFTFPTTIRSDEKAYPTSGHSDNFTRFIEKELQPFVSHTYKTTTTNTLIGQSLGGLLATEILFKRPELFDKYIIVSPSLWWDNGLLLNTTLSNLRDKSIYIGVGKEGLTPTVSPRVMEVDANLLTEKIKMTKSNNVKVYFDYLPQENHATILHQAVLNSFRFLYPLTSKK
jgi:predicted alpha/beta superfamily hydrolase